MGSHVVLDVSLEALVAHIALIHLLPLVVAQDVSLQRVRSGIGFFTEVTLKLLNDAQIVKLSRSTRKVNNQLENFFNRDDCKNPG